MLVIRMQRTGRKGHAMFRVVVQDSRRTPTSGKVVANLGSYDPHSKNVTLDKERAEHFLTHGAQPSERAARILQSEGIELPKWVKQSAAKQGTVRNAEKRRSTAPAPEVEEVPEAPEASEAPVAEAPAEEAPAEEAAEAPAEEPSEA
jgi:small subunit ribosomal protein S16